jgi:CpeT/CpcT family (DUF1001)
MALSSELITLGRYLAGEFDNRAQALAEPAWYVHLRLWQRPTPLFAEDSIALFVEQANTVYPDQPYRQRLLRLRQGTTSPPSLQVDYYKFKDLAAVRGASQNPMLLQQLRPEQVEFLPGCTLEIETKQTVPNQYLFRTLGVPGQYCCFTYQDKTYQVSLGFEATSEELRVYDKGIDPKTGSAIWGAMLGPFKFRQRQDFSAELAV